MDIEQIMAQLTKATDAQLNEALTAIAKEAAELGAQGASTENVEKLTALRDAQASIRTELASGARATARQELADKQEGLLKEFSTEADAAAGGDNADGADNAADQGDNAGGGDSTAGGEADGGDAGGSGDSSNETDQGDGEFTAGGQKARRKLGTLNNQGEPGPHYAGQVQATTRASVEMAGAKGETPISMGQNLDRASLAQAFAHKANSIRAAGNGRTERFSVATVEFAYPPERTLTKEGWLSNTEKIEAASPAVQVQQNGQQGLTAALCGPLQPLYDISVLGVTERPIRDMLSRFAVERGGITYRLPFDALAGLATTGMGIWTPADDDEDPLVEKTCLEVDCPAPVSANVYATYLCLTFPNMTARFDREWVDATTRAALVAWARFAENLLLIRLLAGSKQLTAPVQVSATRDILTNIDKVVAYYRYRHRLNNMVPLRWLAPRWVQELMRADLTRGFSGDLDALAVADATIMRWFAARGVRVTFHLDGLAAGTYTADEDPDNVRTVTVAAGNGNTYANAAAASAIPDFPDTLETVLFADGDWLFLDGGTMDLGLVRDSTLNVRNRYQTFVETFEGIAFNGLESLRLTMDVEPTGLVVGTTMPPVSDIATLPQRTVVTPAP